MFTQGLRLAMSAAVLSSSNASCEISWSAAGLPLLAFLELAPLNAGLSFLIPAFSDQAHIPSDRQIPAQ